MPFRHPRVCVALTGFEPIVQESKSCVLPLHYKAIRTLQGNRTPIS
jgi:hypothetical protein